MTHCAVAHNSSSLCRTSGRVSRAAVAPGRDVAKAGGQRIFVGKPVALR